MGGYTWGEGAGEAGQLEPYGTHDYRGRAVATMQARGQLLPYLAGQWTRTDELLWSGLRVLLPYHRATGSLRTRGGTASLRREGTERRFD